MSSAVFMSSWKSPKADFESSSPCSQTLRAFIVQHTNEHAGRPSCCAGAVSSLSRSSVSLPALMSPPGSHASRRVLFPASRRCCHRPASRHRRHGRPQVLHHLLTQSRRLHRRLALRHLAPLLEQRADALVRHGIEETVSLALPRPPLARRIAVPASPIHASLSATARQAWQSVPHDMGIAASIHTPGHTALVARQHRRVLPPHLPAPGASMGSDAAQPLLQML